MIDLYTVTDSFFTFSLTSWYFSKHIILSILLVSEQIKLLNIEINYFDAVIGIIQW